MPKIAKELSALAVKNLKHSGKNDNPERHAVGGVSGLLVQITNNNAKSWLLRTTIAGKRQFLGLGAYPEVGLKDARERAAEEKLKVRNGLNPTEQRKVAKAALAAARLRGKTFGEIIEEYLNTKLQDKGEKSRKQWRMTLELHAKPFLGAMLCDDIGVHDILRVLEPIWAEKTETARRLRGRIESILSYAIVKGHRKGDNPARWSGHLKEILPMPSKISKIVHMPAVQVKEIADWYAALKQRDGVSAKAVQFLALTAARSGEVRGAVWSEIDLDAKLWIIPAERMKMRREHRVPLSDQAIEILNNVPRFKDSEYVFPAARGGSLTDMSLSSVMKRMHEGDKQAGSKGWLDVKSGRPAVPHGLRSTFRDWAGEKTDYPREIIELCLAHDIAGSVERAYRRGDIIEKRRQIMGEWAKFLSGII